jgi:YHS domain-containing protein
MAQKKENQLVEDVVCGMVKPVNQMKAKTVFKGKTFYFCWKQDKQMFLANPDYWLKRNKK